MRVLSKDELEHEKEFFIEELQQGKIFIYPTDTIYGIGCSALDEKAVKAIRALKQRPDRPFSIMVPDAAWIEENCEVDDAARDWLKRLPGPYTFILKLKRKDAVAPSVNPKNDTIGVRIPDHWMKDIVSYAGFPIICPSANVSGRDFMTSMDNLDPELKADTDYMVDVGEISGRPSKIVNLTGDEPEIRER